MAQAIYKSTDRASPCSSPRPMASDDSASRFAIFPEPMANDIPPPSNAIDAKSMATNIFIVVISLVMIWAVWEVTRSLVARDRAGTIATAVKLNSNLAMALEEYVSRTIMSVDILTRQLKREYARSGIKTDIVQLVSQLGIDESVIANVAIVDKAGLLTLSAFSPKPMAPVDLSDLEHFKIHADERLDYAFVGKPLRSRITGKFAVPITRRINNPDGSFGGVAMVQIDPAYFIRFYGSATIQRPDFIALVGLDGTVRAQRHGKIESCGEDMRQDPILARVLAHPAGELVTFDTPDGSVRHASYRTFAKLPLFIMVGASEADILSNFYRRKANYYGGAVFISLLIALLAALLLFSRLRQQRIVTTLQASESRFRILVESLPQLVWICNQDAQGVYFNQKWIDFSGMTFAENRGEGWHALLHRDDHMRVRQAWEMAIMTCDTFDVECRLRGANGQFRWMLVRGLPLEDFQRNAIMWLGTSTDIEEQKHIEKILQESERFSRATIDAFSKHIAVIDASGRILAVNKAWKNFAALNLLDGLAGCEGANYLEVCRKAAASGDKDAATVIQLIADITAGKKKTGALEYPCHTPSKRRWFLLKIDRFDDAEPVRLVIAHENITEQKLATQRIDFQAHLLDSVGEAVIATDIHGAITYWNKHAEKLYGWPFTDVVGRDIIAVTRIELTDCAPDVLTSPLAFSDHWSGEFIVQSRKGKKFPVRVSNTPIYDDIGMPVGVVGVYSDITQRKIFERRLREEEQRFKAISSNIPGMVFELQKADKSLKFTYASEGAVDVFGVAAEEMMVNIGRFIALLDEESITSFYMSMAESAESMLIWNWEGSVKKGQERYAQWVNLRATPRLTSDACIVWDGVIFNITETKEYQASLQEKSRQLQDLSAHQVTVKEDERKRIAREIHDELGQRLTALRMDVMMLRKQSTILAEQEDVLCGMRDSIDQILKIIRNIASALRPAALDIGFVMAVEWLIDEFQARMKIPCKFTNFASDSIAMNDECATGAFRILQESLTNVARHAHASSVEIILDVTRHFLVLKISDNGVGFDEASVMRRRSSYGLVGMNERAIMLNGEIRIDSRPGEGTTVQVSIPIYPPDLRELP